MSDFINTVRTKDGTEYEVHDSRMPEIPSGGTKLYLHSISGENDGIRFISTVATPVTDGDSFTSALEGLVSYPSNGFGSGHYNRILMVEKTFSVNALVTRFANDGTISTTSINMTDWVDTVTEL